MIQYFVVSDGGRRYGPADVDTLVRWAGEGRIIPATVLVERGTGRELRADSLTAVRVALQKLQAAGGPVIIEPGRPDGDETMTARGALPRVPLIPDEPLPASPPPALESRRSRIVAGLLGVFLGGVGAHRFYLGYPWIGLLQLVSTALCGIGIVWGFVEGVLCLCGAMKDADGLPLRGRASARYNRCKNVGSPGKYGS